MQTFEQKLKVFGDKIKSLRMEKGWSISDLSKKSGISSKYLKCIEKGLAKNINIRHAESLGDVFNLTPKEFLYMF